MLLQQLTEYYLHIPLDPITDPACPECLSNRVPPTYMPTSLPASPEKMHLGQPSDLEFFGPGVMKDRDDGAKDLKHADPSG